MVRPVRPVRARAAAAAVLAILVGGAAPAAEHETKGGHRVWIPDDLAPGTARGALVHRDYGAQPRLFADAEWRAFAEKTGFIQLLFVPNSGKGKKDEVSLSVGKGDVRRLDAALDEAAALAQRPDLRGLPFVALGVSRGGANSICMAQATPERAIAAVAHHGISGVGLYRPPVPVLYTMASNDPTRNVELDTYFRSILRKPGCLWSIYFHKNDRHNSTGDNAYAIAWLDAVIAMRLGRNGRLMDVDPRKARWGAYTLKDGRTENASWIDVSVAERHDPTRTWIPTAEVAALWLKNVSP